MTGGDGGGGAHADWDESTPGSVSVGSTLDSPRLRWEGVENFEERRHPSNLYHTARNIMDPFPFCFFFDWFISVLSFVSPVDFVFG